jgi:hypothetical protein
MYDKLTHRRVIIEVNPENQDWIWSYDEMPLDRFSDLWAAAQKRVKEMGVVEAFVTTSCSEPLRITIEGWVSKTSEEIERSRKMRIQEIEQEMVELRSIRVGRRKLADERLTKLQKELNSLR